MTIDKLEQYYGLASEIEAIEQEINQLYKPISSPNGRTDPGWSTTPRDPTNRSVMRIIQLRDKLEDEKTRLRNLAEEIENWLPTVTDSEVRSIIRWHYLLRLDWKRTNMRVYGYPDYWYSRQRIHRFFDKLSK